MGLHRLFGLAVDSDLSLPLRALDPAFLQRNEVVIQVRRTAVSLDGDKFWQAPDETPFACYRDDQTVILDWPGARFRVTPEQIEVDAAEEAAAIVLLLQGVWSVLLSSRGQESLHACTFVRNDAGVAIVGESGSGKSTIGLALHEAGWLLLADDLLTFNLTRQAIPGPPFIRLTPDRWDGRAGDVDATGKLRCHVPTVASPMPLSGIIVHSSSLQNLRQLTGRAAVDSLLSNAYNDAVPYPGQGQRRFDLALDLAGTVPIYGAPPRSLTVAQVEAILGRRDDDGNHHY